MGRKVDNLIGQQFKNWIVIERDINTTNKAVFWICKCTCGCNEIRSFRSSNLKTENYGNCIYSQQLIKKEKEDNRKKIIESNKLQKYTQLIGIQFGNLIVKKFNGYNKHKELMWLYECQCENKNLVICSSHNLTHGKKDNCGCLTKEKQSKAKKKYNTYNLSGEYGIGYTLKGEEFYFDLEDYDKIKNYCWGFHDGYLVSRDKDKYFIRLHRLIMNAQDGDYVDHKNHDTSDNRKFRLRITTNQENTMNHVVNCNSTSGVSGVNWDKETQMWRSRIWKNYKCIHLGRFTNFDDAVRVRKEAEVKYFKEFRYKEGE